MEYAPRCLLDLDTTGALKTGDAEIYLQQILAGTAHIHKLGFAHRDLKLENVVFGLTGRPRPLTLTQCVRPGSADQISTVFRVSFLTIIDILL